MKYKDGSITLNDAAANFAKAAEIFKNAHQSWVYSLSGNESPTQTKATRRTQGKQKQRARAALKVLQRAKWWCRADE